VGSLGAGSPGRWAPLRLLSSAETADSALDPSISPTLVFLFVTWSLNYDLIEYAIANTAIVRVGSSGQVCLVGSLGRTRSSTSRDTSSESL
jgi:hypothetical protein